MPNEITTEDVSLLIDNRIKELELSNVKGELDRIRTTNENLVTKLASSMEEVNEIKEEIQEAVAQGAEANEGEPTSLGEVLEKVAGIESTIADFGARFEEFSSKFEDICSSIKTITPLAAGVGKMSLSSDEEVEAEQVELDTASDEEVEAEQVELDTATDEEVEAAIKVIETYIEEVGTLPEVVEEGDDMQMSACAKKAKALASLKDRIKAKKPVEASSVDNSALIRSLKQKYGKRTIEASSVENTVTGDEYVAGELADRLFRRK